jgi:cytochrome c peroxidase
LDEPDLGLPPEVAPTVADQPRQSGLNPRLLRRFQVLRKPPASTGLERVRIDLGKLLFFEHRLSKHGDTSCSSCHQLDRGGADPRTTSIGTGGRKGKRNAPSVYNAAWHIAQFWDGRAASLEEQAKAPFTNPAEMAMLDPGSVVAVLRGIPGYVSRFERAFPGQPITFDQVGEVLAAFERTLITPARWDRYLEGDLTALTPAEVEGVKVFADVGCVQCHTGELIGGSMFQKVGVMEPWPNQQDLGRYEVTKQLTDRMMFKVPSLRNVKLTAPYFHDGSVPELATAVRMMGHHQLGIELTDPEVTSIVAWFDALTGEAPAITPPTLP